MAPTTGVYYSIIPSGANVQGGGVLGVVMPGVATATTSDPCGNNGPLHVYNPYGMGATCYDAALTARLAAADIQDETTACEAYMRATGADGTPVATYKYTYDLRVHTEAYNILEITHGMGGLEYAN